MGYEGPPITVIFDAVDDDEVCRELTEAAGDRMTENIKLLTPVDTGELRDSITKKLLVVTAGYRGMVYESGSETNVDYGPFVEFGTGVWGPNHLPYIITPKNPDGWLRFIGRDGNPVFAKRVIHPGSPGANMFADGATATEAEFETDIAPRILDEWAARQEAKIELAGSRGFVTVL